MSNSVAKSTNLYLVPALRNADGQLNADAVSKAFGFDAVDFSSLEPYVNREGTNNFNDVAYQHGCDILAQVARAVMIKVGAKNGDDEAKAIAAMQTFMREGEPGATNLDRIREGEALLVFEEMYGGLRKDPFKARTDDDGEIADWLGLDRAELRAVAVKNGLAVLEALASVMLETGYTLEGIANAYKLASGGSDLRHLAQMFSGRGVMELYDHLYILMFRGARQLVESPLLGNRIQVIARL